MGHMFFGSEGSVGKGGDSGGVPPGRPWGKEIQEEEGDTEDERHILDHFASVCLLSEVQ